MSTNVTISRVFNPNTNQIDFSTDTADCDPAFVAALEAQKVNLSRGHTRMYGLTTLSNHNGTGANWKDGRDIHTKARLEAYLARTDADIATAVAAAKDAFAQAQNKLFSTTPTVVAVVACS